MRCLVDHSFRLSRILATVLVAALAACNSPTRPQPAAPESRGTVSGVVARVQTGVPLVAVVRLVIPSQQTRTVTTAADGRYTFTDLPLGAATLSVSASGYRPADVAIVITATTTQNVELVPEPAPTPPVPVPTAQITGRVVSQPTSKPITAAAVGLRIPPAQEWTAVTDSNGHWTISGLPIGATASLTIDAPGHSGHSASVTIADGLDLPVALEPVAPLFTTIVRAVDAFARTGLAGLVAAGTGLVSSPTGADGRTQISVDTPSSTPRRVTISGPGAVERTTFLRVPGPDAEIDVIPSSFDMRTFDVLARPYGRIIRWDSAPVLAIERRVLECQATTPDQSTATATAMTNTDAVVAEIDSQATSAIGQMTGGRIPAFETVETQLAGVGAMVNLMVPGRITIARCTFLAERTGAVGYSKWDYDGNGRLTAGAIVIDYLYDEGAATAERFHLRSHELGHTLGYAHVDVPSIMNIGGGQSLVLTQWDTLAMGLAYRRPPGSMSPDVDPDGVSVNSLRSGSGLAICRPWR